MAKMPFEEEVRLLSMADVLQPLSEEEIRRIAGRFRDVRLGRGEVLFSPDEHAEYAFILKEGRVLLYRTDLQGHEVTLSVVEGGMMFGEGALSARRVRVAYARAEEPSVVLPLRREDLKELILRVPEVGLRVIEWLTERVRRLEIRLEDTSSKEAPARLASLIIELVEGEGVVTGDGYAVPTRYTHEQLGAMIGANRVTVSRAMAELREAGALGPGRRICVRDIEALGRLAEAEDRARRVAEHEHEDA